MGLVTDTLIELLHQQVEDHGAVVWYDPERAYGEVARSLTPEQVGGAAVHRYEPERGFVWLRRELEPVWSGRTEPPRLVVYVPLSPREARHALIEFEVAGAVLRPGQQPLEQNTGLAVVARRALQQVFPPPRCENIVREVEDGKLTLQDLDRLAEQGIEAQAGAVALVFGTGNPTEVALRFLSDPSRDAQLVEKGAVGNLAELLSSALGVSLPDKEISALRAALARQVLLTDLIQAVGDHIPKSLRTVRIAGQPVARQMAIELARTWRNRRDTTDSYENWANQVQAEIGDEALHLSLDVLEATETFAAGEVQLQEEVEKALLERPTPELVRLAESRRQGFWSERRPEIKMCWDVIIDAGRVLLTAARVESALKGKAGSAEALFAQYTAGDEPWCELDTWHRRLERDYHWYDPSEGRDDVYRKLVARARQRYTEVLNLLTERFVKGYADAHFEIPRALLQADIFQKFVASAAKRERVAYILVDALRFEMGRELASMLRAEDQAVELRPALATPPTITEVGMAALMPGAEVGLSIGMSADGLLLPAVGSTLLKTRQERMDYVRAAMSASVVDASLNDLAPLSDVHLRDALRNANLAVVTATEEIDGISETNPANARRLMDDVFSQLRRGIRTLLNLGFSNIVITSDHGFLFGEKLSAGESIDPPKAKKALLKRRVWVGKGGVEIPGVLRAPLSAFGISSDLEMATPSNLSCFKVKGGGTEYFHGGLSLPELVIPVLEVRQTGTQAQGARARISWTLELGSKAITTRFVSVNITGQAEELLPIEPPTVRIEVRAGDQIISVPVATTYGFQETTKDVVLKADPDRPGAIAQNTITLLITEEPKVDQITLYLLDAATGVVLKSLERVPINISL